METERDFWKPNLSRPGRRLRFHAGWVLCLAGLAMGIFWMKWVGAIVAIAGAFLVYEGARGWCVVRACGFKTRI